MDKELARQMVLDAWVQWKKNPVTNAPKTSNKLGLCGWIGKKLGVAPPSKTAEFATWFFVQNRKLFNGVYIADIESWIKQNDAEEALARSYEKLDAEITKLLKPHLSTLAKKRQRKQTKDDYGFIDDKKWHNELEYFIDKGIMPHIQQRITNVALHISENAYCFGNIADIDQDTSRALVNAHIRELITNALEQIPNAQFNCSIDIASIDSLEYEHACADFLKESGWKVRVTQPSRDQGIDILAEKQGVLLAIQCKKYASPVGNKAVKRRIQVGPFTMQTHLQWFLL